MKTTIILLATMLIFTFSYSMDKARYYDLVDDDTRTNTTAFDVPVRGGFTFQGWLKSDGVGNAGGSNWAMIFTYNNTVQNVRTTGGNMFILSNTASGANNIDTGYKLRVGVWEHVTFTYTNGLSKTYVNGNLVNVNTSSTGAEKWFDGGLILFGGGISNYMAGCAVCEVRMFSFTMNEAQVKETWNKVLTSKMPTLQARYHFQETSSADKVMDSALKNELGTLVGTTIIDAPRGLVYE